MTGRECTCSALPMYQHPALTPFYFVCFLLCDVMAHIVDQFEARAVPENSPERPTQKVRYSLPVGPGEIRGRRHCTQVRLPFLRTDWCTRELPVRQRDVVLGHDLIHQSHI